VNKSDLATAVAGRTELSKSQVVSALDAAIDVIAKTLRKGEDVRLVGLGTFYVMRRKAITGRNPRTGAPIPIKPGRVPKFKAGKALKQSLD
jgi:DNA-binding protein HU-beta